MAVEYVSSLLDGEGGTAFIDSFGAWTGAGYYNVNRDPEAPGLGFITSPYTAPAAPAPAPASTPTSGGSTGGSTAAATGSSSGAAAPTAGTTAAPQKKRMIGGYDEFTGAPAAWRGAGWYTDEELGLGAEQPVGPQAAPGAQGQWYFDPQAGTWRQYNPDAEGFDASMFYATGGSGLGPVTLDKAYGGLSRDSIINNFYTPFANVPGVVHPDEFIKAGYNPDAYARGLVYAGSEDPNEAGRSFNHLQTSVDILDAYLNQPALLAARGGQRINPLDIPQLNEAYTKAGEFEKKVAQQSHEVNTNTGGLIGGLSLMDLIKGLSVMAPGLGALGGAAGAALSGGLEGLTAFGAAMPEIGGGLAVSQAPLASMGLKALNIVSPEIGSIAGLINGGAGMLGGWGNISDTLGNAFSPTEISGTLSSAADSGAGNFGLGTSVTGGVSNSGDFGGGNFGLSGYNPDVVESGINAQLTPDMAAQFGLNPQFAADFLGSAAPGMIPGAPDVSAPEAPTAPAGVAAPEAGGLSLPGNVNPMSILSMAQQVSKLLGSNSSGEEQKKRPVRAEGQTDQQYAQDVADWAVQYLDLDVAALEKAGLEPGSPEYLNYILEQSNSVIAQIFGKGGLKEGETVADLQGQLADLTTKELQQLDRALFVRGELGKLMGSGDYFDPFGGRMEDVAGPGTFNTARAAYQRGIARSTDELAGLRGDEARQYLGGMLGRKVDLYGLQGRQDAEMLRARLLADEDMSEEERKRRLAAADKGDWASAFQGVSDTDQGELFRGISSPRQQAALLQAIFGD